MSELRSSLRSTRQWRLALLALVLLLAQTGALMHAYSHDAAGAHRQGEVSTKQCGYCLAAAPLLGGGHSQSLTLAEFLALMICVLSVAQIVVFLFQHPAFRSRAPPHP